jgi:hypothetical protein
MRRSKIQSSRFRLLIFAVLALAMSTAVGQTTSRSARSAEVSAGLKHASDDYKSSVERLLALYEAESQQAEAKLKTVKQLLAQGLVTRSEVQAAEQAAAQKRIEVAEAQVQLKSAEVLISEAMVEVEAEEPTPKIRSNSAARAANTMVQTTAYIRFGGAHAWALSDASAIKQFFTRRFGRALPIGAFGQSALHDRWGYDHRNAMDVGVSPDTAEGQALMEYLRANGIPFTAFHFAVPGKATGPHIHVGLPSHRIAPRLVAANAGNISR